MDWDGPQGPITIYYDSIVIRAKDSTGLIGNMPVKSPKLGTGMANPILDFQFCTDPTAIEHDGRLYVYGTMTISNMKPEPRKTLMKKSSHWS